MPGAAGASISCGYLAAPGTMLRMPAGERLVAQLRRGVLEYCVLALLAGEDRYGFDLVRTLGGIDGMVVSEGTLYPLLSRMKREGYVKTKWRESEAGPPRKYYSLSEDGRDALDAFTQEWTRFRDAVDHVLSGGTD